jgi:hypothetical protein
MHAQIDGGYLPIQLGPEDRIQRIKFGFMGELQNVQGINFIEIWDNARRHQAVGDRDVSSGFVECSVPEGFVGLKGFYGYHTKGKVIERIGVIWGK